MKPSSESSAIHETAVPYGGGLDLPSEPGFVSSPPLVSLAVMAERIRQLRRMFPNGIPTEEERWRRKCDVEFRL